MLDDGASGAFTIAKGLKKGKAPGRDGIINEILKYGGSRMVEVLCSPFNSVMESRYWPDDWRWSYIVHSLKLGMRRWLVIIVG